MCNAKFKGFGHWFEAAQQQGGADAPLLDR
jgi:hypothetical protein